MIESLTLEPKPAAAQAKRLSIAAQALRDAIDSLAPGGQTRIAETCGITPQAVAQWHICPTKWVIRVERLSGISRYRLRPDIYPRD